MARSARRTRGPRSDLRALIRLSREIATIQIIFGVLILVFKARGVSLVSLCLVDITIGGLLLLRRSLLVYWMAFSLGGVAIVVALVLPAKMGVDKTYLLSGEIVLFLANATCLRLARRLAAFGIDLAANPADLLRSDPTS